MSLREQAAREAFVYGVPPVALYRVLHDLVLAPPGRRSRTSFNRPVTGRVSAGLGGVPGPATPGSVPFCGWLDLRGGPVVLSVPADHVGESGTASAALFDLYAEPVGRLPSGTGDAGSSVLLVGPSWEPPTLPTDVGVVVRCRTDLCLVVGQLIRGERDDGVRELLRPMRVRPVDEGTVAVSPLPAPVPPVDVCRPPTADFLRVLDWVLQLMPAMPGEEELRAELETIGVSCGADLLEEALAEDRLDGQLTEGLRRGFDDVRHRVATLGAGGPHLALRLDRAARVTAGLLEEAGGRRTAMGTVRPLVR